MIAFIIGLSSGLLLIAAFVILKKYDKKLVYGLTLTGIGFLYVGYTHRGLLKSPAWVDNKCRIPQLGYRLQ
jgi:hypothetical protein